MATILIVDDHPDSRWVLADLTRREGHPHDGLRHARELGADRTIREPIDLFVVRKAVAELLAV